MRQASDSIDAGTTSRPDIEQPVITDLANFLRGTRMLLPIAVLGIFLMGLVAFLYWAKPFMLPVVLAFVLSFLLRPVVKALYRRRVPEMLGTVLVLSAFCALVALIVSHLIQPASQWAARAPETLQKVELKVQSMIRSVTQLGARSPIDGSRINESAGSLAPALDLHQRPFPRGAFTFAGSVAMAAIETAVLLFFFLAMGDVFTQKLVKILPTLRDKRKAVEITGELQHNISVFLFTITLINTCLGALVGFSLALIGMPNALLWGTMAALLNFIPYFGPLIGVVILSLVGFVTFDAFGQALLPPIVYLLLHTIEANFITPLILGRRLTMNPVIIFLALMFWMWLWGVPGALLSVPLLMMFKILCDHFRPLAPIGEFISGPERKSRPLRYQDYMKILENSRAG